LLLHASSFEQSQCVGWQRTLGSLERHVCHYLPGSTAAGFGLLPIDLSVRDSENLLQYTTRTPSKVPPTISGRKELGAEEGQRTEPRDKDTHQISRITRKPKVPAESTDNGERTNASNDIGYEIEDGSYLIERGRWTISIPTRELGPTY
jgi:hypothetical protein